MHDLRANSTCSGCSANQHLANKVSPSSRTQAQPKLCKTMLWRDRADQALVWFMWRTSLSLRAWNMSPRILALIFWRLPLASRLDFRASFRSSTVLVAVDMKGSGQKAGCCDQFARCGGNDAVGGIIYVMARGSTLVYTRGTIMLVSPATPALELVILNPNLNLKS